MTGIADLHTHTIASTHAYSTILENALQASKRGLLYLATTDHGPAMEDAPHRWHFANLKAIPETLYGVRILKGTEANILPGGWLDLEDNILKELDWVVASIHESMYPPENKERNTEAYCRILSHPYVDMLGHIALDAYPFDDDAVLETAHQYSKIVEIKGIFSSSNMRQAYHKLAISCRRHKVLVSVTSDAHFAGNVGKLEDGMSLLQEINYPRELIVGASTENMENFLALRKVKSLCSVQAKAN